ncbi:hypothetical protein P5P86_04955 [Nocardioides sp. BP30]|uniref:hypothetical protein n=1 Tax=Nocardioides sp. BP30 TaxID=3036374 RepID=UPI002469B33F|nr:hypothetical protein [Nocardioides sp. BP30]WGL53174.1 hypothetical protein P5P86_04955 [Nocardioides sp. BP30]
MFSVGKLLRVLSVAAVAAGSLAMGSAADAAGASTFREVNILSGSPSYLVYETVATRIHRNGSRTSTATLSYIAARGKPHALATGVSWTGRSVLQAGSTVVYADPSVRGDWRWRDLSTGASGSVPAQVRLPGTAPHGWAGTGHVVAAAPDGWILTRDIVASTPSAQIAPTDGFFLQHADGAITALGVPARGSTANATSSALVAFDAGYREGQTRGASLMTFASPGSYVPLGPVGSLLHCASASATRVACAEYDQTSKRLAYQGIAVFDAAGHTVLRETNRCAVDSYASAQGPYALFGKGLAWVSAHRSGGLWGGKGRHCATHRLIVRTAAGRLVHEPGRYVGNPVAALGGVVVGNQAAGPASSSELVLFTSAHHHRTLVSAR